ncbi:MAG TPA: PAS domain-containing protein [Candidatus Angelobacter sp.]
MEYLWRHPHALAHANRAPGAKSSFSFLSQRNLNGSYRRILLTTAVLAFLAHALVLALFPSRGEGQLLSNLLQLLLGLLAFLAMLDAGQRSRLLARRIWFYAAAAIGAYTAGQLVLIGYTLFQQGPRFIPRISDQFFFFWVVPLLAASAIDTLGWHEGFDLAALLDFTQFLILGVALHISVFGDPLRWQSHAQEMEFLKLKVRVIRDILVLGWLWGRAWLTGSRQLRSVFMRLGFFYLAYSLADGIYLSAEAAWQIKLGTWFDLLWSLPRLTAVVLALTWAWTDASGVVRPSPRRRSYIWLQMAPIVVPLVMLGVSLNTFTSSPFLWASLMVSSFAVVSMRLLITQSRQERAHAELRHSNELLHSIVEGTSEAIYLKDPEGRYKLINTAGARYMGHSREEVLGKTDRELLSAETVVSILKTDEQVLTRGESVTCEEVLFEGGVTRTFLSTKNPYRDSDGQIIGVLGISVEITEHRRMEEQLRRAQRMESVGAFSGAIAHDFSNLLTVIKGYSQLSLSERQHHPGVYGNLEQIVKATDRATALIRQLLAFGRQQVLQPRVLNLNDVISHLQQMLRRLIGEDVEITTRFDVDLWPVKADPGQVEQVLMNLAANSRDAMPTGGKLILQTANVHLDESYARSHVNVQPGDYAMFAVSDTGMGMDAQILARIFEPFFTTKPVGKGTGLGLATTYGIVKQSGGYIAVESEPGVGTTFKVYLPRVDQPLEYHTGGEAGTAFANQ